MIHCQVGTEQWALTEPFAIARGTMTHVSVMVVTLTDDAGHRGWAEAAGVDYDGETMASLVTTVEAFADRMTDDITGESLLTSLPPGGGRNALDCALWDLRAKQHGVPAWQRAGLPPLTPLTTDFTIGLGSEAVTRRKAKAARHFPLLKLKADAERHLDVVRWVREEHPSARLVIDANQSWNRDLLDRILPSLAAAGVELVEQPVKRGEDAQLDGLQSPIPLAADESCVDRASLAAIRGRYQYINIKLDKSGGLTEALALAHEARRQGLGLMVGNMCGTSLGMAPAFLIGQLCRYVDLDGPLLQTLDRASPMLCADGVMSPPTAALWG